MFKEVYNRCKSYLNSYVTFGTVLVLLFFLMLPTFTYKEAGGFFFIIINTYQYSLVNVLFILLCVYNIWNYLHKTINIVYQAHRYGSVKRIIKNTVCDVVFIGIVLEIVFTILNISISIFSNDGYYLSLYKFYEITNLSYSIYIFEVRLLFVSILSVIVYFIYYTNKNWLKLLLSFVIIFNLLNINCFFPITMNSILSGYEYNSFFTEIISTLMFIGMYVVCLVLIQKRFINKKRDIR